MDLNELIDTKVKEYYTTYGTNMPSMDDANGWELLGYIRGLSASKALRATPDVSPEQLSHMAAMAAGGAIYETVMRALEEQHNDHKE